MVSLSFPVAPASNPSVVSFKTCPARPLVTSGLVKGRICRGATRPGSACLFVAARRTAGADTYLVSVLCGAPEFPFFAPPPFPFGDACPWVRSALRSIFNTGTGCAG